MGRPRAPPAPPRAPRPGPPGPALAPRCPGRRAEPQASDRDAGERAERHAPRQPRLHQVPARPRGHGRRRARRPARGPRARPAAARAAPARRRLALRVPGSAGAGAGPGGLQRRPVPLLPSAGECSPPALEGHCVWPPGPAPRTLHDQGRKATLSRGRAARGQPGAGPGAPASGPRARTRRRSAGRPGGRVLAV